jgi:hypothetical protein
MTRDHDYVRGRAAISRIRGRTTSFRPVTTRRSQMSMVRLLVATAIGAMTVAVATLAFSAPSSRESVGVVPDRQGSTRSGIVTRTSPAPTLIPAVSRDFGDWDEVIAAIPWAGHPDWLPDGFERTALQGFGPSTDPASIDSLVASYTGLEGARITVDQFWIAAPAAFDVRLTLPGNLPESVGSGETMVAGATAYWAEAVVILGPDGTESLDTEVVVLTWADGSVGYRLAGRGVGLETLESIGESLVRREP